MTTIMFETRFITTITLLFGWVFGLSQSILENYIEEGLQNNQQLLQEIMSVESSKLALAEANGLFMPTVNFQSDYTIADGGRAIQFPVGDLFNPVYATLNQITETQTFPTDLENVNEQFLPNDFHDTKIRLIQPLFNSDIYFNQKANERLVAMTEARRAAYEMELKKEIKVAYFNHLQAAQSISIYESNIIVLEELVRFNQSRYEQDLITLDEVYSIQYELQALQADKASAEAQVVTSQAYFNFLLNRSVDSRIEIDRSLEVRSILEEPMALKQVFQNRSELQQIKSAQEAQEYGMKLAAGSKLPRLTGVLDLGYQGNGYTFDSEQNYYLVNFSLSWNIFNGFQNHHNFQRQHVELKKLESQEVQLKKQIALQVLSAEKALIAAQKRLQAKTLAQKSASKSLEIMTSKYRAEQALLVEYLDAQSNLLTADLETNIARYQLLAKEAELDRTLAY